MGPPALHIAAAQPRRPWGAPTPLALGSPPHSLRDTPKPQVTGEAPPPWERCAPSPASLPTRSPQKLPFSPQTVRAGASLRGAATRTPQAEAAARPFLQFLFVKLLKIHPGRGKNIKKKKKSMYTDLNITEITSRSYARPSLQRRGDLSGGGTSQHQRRRGKRGRFRGIHHFRGIYRKNMPSCDAQGGEGGFGAG